MVAFDRQRVSYSAWLALHHAALRVERIRWLRQLPLARGTHALDVGCGDGSFTGEIADDKRIASLCAVDFDLSVVEDARRNLERKKRQRCAPIVLVADAQHLPFADARFGAVFCLNVLEYVPDIGRAISELMRVTRKGGTIVVKDEDAFRDMLLSWPFELEAEINEAWHEILQKTAGTWRPEAGRQLLGWIADAGGDIRSPQLIVHNLSSPLTPEQELFIQTGYRNYLSAYHELLAPATFRRMCRLLAIGEFEGLEPTLLRSPGFGMQSIEYAVVFSPK